MNKTTFQFAVAFGLVFFIAALAVIGGIKGLTYHKTSAVEIRQAVKSDPGADLGAIAVQTAYSIAEQGGFHIKTAKVTKVKVSGDRAVVTLKIVTLEQGPVTIAVSYVKGVWSYVGAVQI